MIKVCPKCGKKGDFNGSFCEDCAPTLESEFRGRNKKVKPRQLCVKCNKMRFGKIWVAGALPELIEKTQCPDCCLESGGYHEAIIQIRGPIDKAKALAKKAVTKISEKTSITQVDESKHGVDVLVLRKRPAIEFVQSTNKDYVQTRKLVTQTRDGKRVYRSTLCIRLEE